MAFTLQALRTRLDTFPTVDHYLVGYSGGLDSTALLHAIVALGEARGADVSAAHVHHGIHAEADRWVAHCRQFCMALGVTLKVVRITVKTGGGDSLEAAARHARYHALRSLMAPQTCLLTAHQQDDQAETLLLQLLRGAGLDGLAAMAHICRFADGWHARPLLAFSRGDLQDYASRHGLAWIEDPSNRDTAVHRNFLRHEVMPLLKQRWPAATRTLARAASHQAAAGTLLKVLGQEDRKAAAGGRSDTLSVKALAALPIPRQTNVLRTWLQELGLRVPSSTQLEQARNQALSARWDSTPLVHWPGAEVRRHRDDLYAMAPLSEHDSSRVIIWDIRRPLQIASMGLTLRWQDFESQGLTLPGPRAGITIRFRRGGERCKPRGSAHHRPLKKLLQQAGVPPWERDRIPLLYIGEALAAVTGYWICGQE